MKAIYAGATSYVGAHPSVVDLGSALRRFPAGAARPNITRLGSEHEAQLSTLFCGLDKAARINRFGHLASNACVQAYAKDAAAGAAYMAGRSTQAGAHAACETDARRDRQLEGIALARRQGACGSRSCPAEVWDLPPLLATWEWPAVQSTGCSERQAPAMHHGRVLRSPERHESSALGSRISARLRNLSHVAE